MSLIVSSRHILPVDTCDSSKIELDKRNKPKNLPLGTEGTRAAQWIGLHGTRLCGESLGVPAFFDISVGYPPQKAGPALNEAIDRNMVLGMNDKSRSATGSFPGGAAQGENPADIPTVGSMAPPSCALGASNMMPLITEAKAIATGVKSIATHFSAKARPRWWAQLLKAKPFVVAISVVIGALFATEQFLASQEEAETSRVELLFSAATENLASSQLAIQAAAVRALPRLATFRDFHRPEPGDYFFGSNLVNRFLRGNREFPFMERSWTLFKEFAAQPRTSTGSSLGENIVSSAILNEGAAWELRRRLAASVSDPGIGSLLYKADLPNAYGIDKDFRRLNFGSTNLTNANLSASKFDDCGFSGARLDGAIFRGASLKRAYFVEASMKNDDLSFAFLDGAILKHAALQKATFSQTSAIETDFTESLLDRASFSQAVMRGAVFRGASLRNAVFKQTDITSAVFEGADVAGADFTTSIGFTDATLKGAKHAQSARVPAVTIVHKKGAIP